jgi:hypothetical protein
MINIDLWMKHFTELLEDTFGKPRLFYWSARSYGRCEATEIK